MYGRLNSNGDGIVRATTTRALVPPSEGEALVTDQGANVLEARRAAELPEGNVMASGAMQTVRPTECPPCPKPSVIYRTVYRDRVTTVPGPTRYVYSSSPIPGGASAPGGPAYPVPSAPPGASPEQAPADAAGEVIDPALPIVRREQDGRFPWWVLVLAAGGLWLASRKR